MKFLRDPWNNPSGDQVATIIIIFHGREGLGNVSTLELYQVLEFAACVTTLALTLRFRRLEPASSIMEFEHNWLKLDRFRLSEVWTE